MNPKRDRGCEDGSCSGSWSLLKSLLTKVGLEDIGLLESTFEGGRGHSPIRASIRSVHRPRGCRQAPLYTMAVSGPYEASTANIARMPKQRKNRSPVR